MTDGSDVENRLFSQHNEQSKKDLTEEERDMHFEFNEGYSFVLNQANKKSSELKQNSKDIKDKIDKLISFLHDKLHSWYDKDDKYIDVVNDMYDDNVLDDDDIEDLDLIKEKDDFER